MATSFGVNAPSNSALQGASPMIKREATLKKRMPGSADQPGPADVKKREAPNGPRKNG